VAANPDFGAYTTDGETKTYFKPDDGQAYFDRQPGR
jgi:pyocin large subunit-like protein